MEAQREIYQKGKTDKIFIVPLIISYHVVLEAKYLIEQHLKRTGKEKYIRARDEFYSVRKLFKFAWKFFSQPSKITLSFGKPMDIIGNFVDANGLSFDRFGNALEVKEYFMSNGEVVEDLQRETEYTKILAERITERYFKENIVLTSHLVAFAAFNILKKENPKLDLYGLLRLPPEDFVFPKKKMQDVVGQLQLELISMFNKGRIKLSEQIYFEIDEVIKDGVRNIGIYHPEKTLVFNKKDQLISQDFKLLFFYHNRLTNYGLEKAISWSKVSSKEEIEVEVMSDEL